MRAIDEFTPHELEMLELKGMTAPKCAWIETPIACHLVGQAPWDEAREHENDLEQESLRAENEGEVEQ